MGKDGEGMGGNKEYCKGPDDLAEDSSNWRVNRSHQRFLKDWKTIANTSDNGTKTDYKESSALTSEGVIRTRSKFLPETTLEDSLDKIHKSRFSEMDNRQLPQVRLGEKLYVSGQ